MIEHVVITLHILLLCCFLDILLCFFLQVQFSIIVLGSVHCSWPDVQLRFTVSCSRQIFLARRISFLFCSTVHAACNDIPSSIPISDFAFVKWCCSCHCQEQRADHMHLIVHISGMVKILSRESALQTTQTHSKGHGIKINKVRIWLRESYLLFLRLLVHEQRNINLYFMASSYSYVLSQSSKSDMVRN